MSKKRIMKVVAEEVEPGRWVWQVRGPGFDIMGERSYPSEMLARDAAHEAINQVRCLSYSHE